VALLQSRRLELVWSGAEVAAFERLREEAEHSQTDMPDYVKAVLKQHLRKGNTP